MFTSAVCRQMAGMWHPRGHASEPMLVLKGLETYIVVLFIRRKIIGLTVVARIESMEITRPHKM